MRLGKWWAAGLNPANLAGIFGFTDPERGSKESRPFAPAHTHRGEPKTAKYPVQEVGAYETCAGEKRMSLTWKGDMEVSRMGRRSKKPGIRGGNWNNTSTNLRVSDRNNAGWTNTNRNNNVGFRAARTPGRVKMKTFNNLFEKIISFENLMQASYRAQNGKRLRMSTAEFNFFREKEIFGLQDELAGGTYRPGKYRQFYVYEPKPRLISAAPYRDRVVHQALCGVVEPIFESRFIYHSYACRKGKGTHRAILRCQEFARKNSYALQCDIRRYFPSIDHERLYQIFSQRIRDKRVLWLAKVIIDSANGLKVTGEQGGKDIVRGVGMPIGNLTSQFFANVYLNELDYFVKFGLREKYYIRYMDDFLIFGRDKGSLSRIIKKIALFLQDSLRLNLHPNKSTIFPVKSGVDFCGFRIFPYYRRLRGGNVKLFVKRIKKMQRDFSQGCIGIKQVSESIRAWIAHASWANTYRLRKNLFSQIILKRGGQWQTNA